MAEFVKITGLDQTIRALARLPEKLGGKQGGPMRGALFAAASMMKKQVRANTPIGKGTPMPGLLRNSVYVYRRRRPMRGTEHYLVAMRSNRKKGLGRKFGSMTAGAYYWHFVEFGTVKMSARNYMLRAFLSSGRQAVEVFSRELIKGVDSAVKKARMG